MESITQNQGLFSAAKMARLKNTSSLLCANLRIICALPRTNATVSKIDILSDCCILRKV